MALLGSSIDPRLQLQDYSGIVNAAQMQAQGLASIGSQIEAAAEQYKQYKKEQADTQKRVKAAANLADSISALVPELKGPLGATVAQLKDPNLTLSDKDALAQSISNTLQLGIGVVAGDKERALQGREISLRERAFNEGTPEQRAAAKQKKDEFERQNLEAGNYAKGALKNLPPGLAKQVETDYLDPQNYDGIGAKAFVEGLNTAKSQGYEFKQDAGTGTWYAINKNPPFDVQPIPAPMTAGGTSIDQSIQGAAGMPVGQPPSATGISGALYTPGAGVAAPVYQPERDMPGGTILPTISPYYETIQEDLMSAMGMPQAPARQVSPEQVRSATEAAPATPQVPTGAFRTSPSPVVAAAEATRRLNELKIKDLERKEAERLKAEEKSKQEDLFKKTSFMRDLSSFRKGLEKVSQGTGVIGGISRTIAKDLPGSEMSKLENFKKVLDANTFLSTIITLRESSPTGATGLGAVSNAEGERLAASKGSLDPTVDLENAKLTTDAMLRHIATQAYGTPAQLDDLVKKGVIPKDKAEQQKDLYYKVLEGRFDEVVSSGIQAEKQAGRDRAGTTAPSSGTFGGFSPEVQSIIDQNQ